MNFKNFFSGIMKPSLGQNDETKSRLKNIFLQATQKTALDKIILLYGNFEGQEKIPFIQISWANSYIIGFNELGNYLCLVPFKNDFSQFGDPINLLPHNLAKIKKSFVAQGYSFEDKEGNSYTMSVSKFTGNLTALLSQNQIAIDQEDELKQFIEFYNLLKSNY